MLLFFIYKAGVSSLGTGVYKDDPAIAGTKLQITKTWGVEQ